MISRKVLAEAAFWDASVCLDCGEVVEGQKEPFVLTPAIPESCPCGGDLYSAVEVAKILALIEEEEE